MELTQLGRSGLTVSRLAFGAMTFGGSGPFTSIGQIGLPEAERLIGTCLDAGVMTFDTADAYSRGQSEEILGQALGARRGEAIIATKAFGRMGRSAHDVGSSRRHLVRACEASLKRLGTDWIDLYQLHGFDALTPIEESLRALDDLVRDGKVRYVGCSNFAAWQLMKALGIAERGGLERFVSHQIYYSLVGRDAEHELLPLSQDQGVGTIIWSPLAFGFLSGKFGRDEPHPAGTRIAASGQGSLFDPARGHDVLDVVREIAREQGHPVAQVALNWLLRKPGVSSILIGARSLDQLNENIAAASWSLSAEQVARLDAVGAPALPYPQWAQRDYGGERNPATPTYCPAPAQDAHRGNIA